MADLASLYRSLAALHRAGLGWAEAMRSAAPAHGGWEAAHARLGAGGTLPEALEGLAPPLDLALLRAAEASGTFERGLTSLALRHDEAHRAARRRRAALAYPFLLAHVAALLMPIPDLVQRRYGAALLWLLAALVPLYAFWLYARRRPSPDRPLPDRFPFRSRVLEQDADALEALGSLYEAGVPLRDALPLARQAGDHGRVARDLVRAQAIVEDGRPLAGAWSDTPAPTRAALASAEHAGALGAECLALAARMREDAVHRRTVTLARATPLVMLALGGLVALRVISFYAAALGRAGLWR
jgi:type II secretory pathway component PulF